MLSIAILDYEGGEVLEKCLKALKRQSIFRRKEEVEVLLINNGPDEIDLKTSLIPECSFRTIDGTNQHRIITGLNTAIREFKGEWLLFMENDVLFEEDAIETLLKSAVMKEAIYQPVFYREDGKIDNAGMDIWWPGIGIGRRRKWWRDKDLVPCGMVTDIAFMVHRMTLKKVGDYDTLYSPGYYEDVDWAIRSKKLGIYHFLVPKAKAVHLANYSYSKVFSKKDESELCHYNRLKLVNKHYKGLDRLARVSAIRAVRSLRNLGIFSNNK